MHSMTFAPARPLAAPIGDALAVTAAILRYVARAFVPRRSQDLRPSWRQRALDAAQVRRMAMELQHIDPGMASDLYAAADRHQRDFA